MLKRPSLIPLLLVPFAILAGCSNNNATSPTNSGTWVCATDNAPFPGRYGLSGAVFNGAMWIVGGAASDTGGSVTYWYGDVWSSGNGSSWSKASDCGPFGERYGAQALSYNGKLWLIGGNNKGVFKNDVWNSSNGVDWSTVTTNAAFSPREDFGAVVFNNAMWVIGGAATNGVKNDVWSSTDGINWTLVSNNQFTRRWGFAITTFNNLIWIFGGVLTSPVPYEVSDIYRDIWTSPDGANWTQFATTNYGGSYAYYHQVISNGNTLWRTNGYNLTAKEPIAAISNSTDGVNWTVDSSRPYTPRFYHLSLSFNNQVWVIGGCNNIGSLTYFNDVWHTP
jgi:hypothetical protein